MTNIIPKLKDLYKNKELMGDDYFMDGSLRASNLDDVFRKIRVNGVDEVRVDWDEMLLIAMFILGNASGFRPEEWEKTGWNAINIIREGKVDKYLGVNLHLEGDYTNTK